jgi:hypothetical protein
MLRASPDHTPSQTSLKRKISYLTSTRSSSRRLLRKSRSIGSQYLVSQVDATWFLLLPQKIQQRQFTREEQVLFAGRRDIAVLDAADEALYRVGRQPNTSLGSLRTDPTFQSGQNKDMMDAATEKSVGTGDAMDDNLHDSFRWLDEDDELDLTLEDYHHAVTQTTHSPTLRSWRRPSVRRTLSLTSLNPRRSSVSLKTPPSSHAAVAPPRPGLAARPSSSSLLTPRHQRKSSVSSIEPAAQHYQDPEARLKLRVYLASPQKFDEAVEFGFPSLDKPALVPPVAPVATPRKTEETERTFLDDAASLPSEDEDEDDRDEDLSLADPESPRTPQDAIFQSLRPLRQSSVDRVGVLRPRVLGSSPDPYAEGRPGGREMTLHMTLTRPDLRIETEMRPAPATNEDPLRLSDLPLSDERHPIWDPAADERSKMKKLWKKLTSR